MKSLALAIQTFPGGNDALKRHWPNFQLAGAQETIIIGTTDGMCYVPEGIEQTLIGANLYCVSSHLPLRLLRTFQRLLETKSDWCCVAEYDVLFCRPIPRDLPEGLTAHHTGGKPFNSHCNAYYHPPWICDRDTAEVIVRVGYELIAEKTVDPSPDCFLGQITERGKIPVHSDILKSYTQNTIHPPPHHWSTEARAAIDAGAVCIHGCKEQATFDALTK
jgi:hypothetical protein